MDKALSARRLARHPQRHPAPERMFCERGLTDAYCFSRHSYSAICANAEKGYGSRSQDSLVMMIVHEHA